VNTQVPALVGGAIVAFPLEHHLGSLELRILASLVLLRSYVIG
jgi:hypothetical protein